MTAHNIPEGWRLLEPGEPKQVGDRWSYCVQCSWQTLDKVDNDGIQYPYFTYIRKIETMKNPTFLTSPAAPVEPTPILPGDRVVIQDFSGALILGDNGVHVRYNNTNVHSTLSHIVSAIDCVLPAIFYAESLQSINNDVILINQYGKVIFSRMKYLKKA